MTPLSLKDLRPDKTFRDATMDDAGLLYSWRVVSEMSPWYEGRRTSFQEHLDWLEPRIASPLVHILIWGYNEGLVRIDSNGELTFHGGTPGMLEAATVYAFAYGGRLKVTLDLEESAKRVRLYEVGFKSYPAAALTFTK